MKLKNKKHPSKASDQHSLIHKFEAAAEISSIIPEIRLLLKNQETVSGWNFIPAKTNHKFHLGFNIVPVKLQRKLSVSQVIHPPEMPGEESATERISSDLSN